MGFFFLGGGLPPNLAFLSLSLLLHPTVCVWEVRVRYCSAETGKCLIVSKNGDR